MCVNFFGTTSSNRKQDLHPIACAIFATKLNLVKALHELPHRKRSLTKHGYIGSAIAIPSSATNERWPFSIGPLTLPSSLQALSLLYCYSADCSHVYVYTCKKGLVVMHSKLHEEHKGCQARLERGLLPWVVMDTQISRKKKKEK